MVSDPPLVWQVKVSRLKGSARSSTFKTEVRASVRLYMCFCLFHFCSISEDKEDAVRWGFGGALSF
jgi:hypothetical protein